MPSKNDCWGIEVGSHAIKAVRLVKAGGNVHLEDYAILPFKQVLTTPDLNVEEEIQVQLDSFLSKHDVSKSSVIVSVPGNKAFARFASLPPVEKKKVPEIVRFEAVQQIPFPIEEVEWDYQIFQQEESPDIKVGIFAITKERIAHFLSNFNAVNMKVDAVTLSPLAVFNAFHHEDPEADNGAIYIDIGTESTDVIIVEGGSVWTRTLQIGGNNFTNALVESFKLSFPKAEKLKKEARTSKYARQIFQAMRPVFADLVQEVQRSLGYYKSINRDSELNKIVGLGSTFKLPGLQKFLKQQLQMDVSRPDGYKQIDINGRLESDVAENAVNLATAYGLALQGLELDAVNANILPDMILRERMWKVKQPWFAAAAAALVATTAAAAAVYMGDNSATEKSFKSPAARTISQVVSLAKQESNKYSDVSTEDPRVKIENLYRMLDYRDLWPAILADISEATNSLVDGADRDTQMAAFEADYKKIEDLAEDNKLARAQRKRIYIDSIKTEYIPTIEEEDEEGSGGMNFDMMGGGMMGGMGEMGMMGGMGGMGGGVSLEAEQITGRFDEDEFWKEVAVEEEELDDSEADSTLMDEDSFGDEEVEEVAPKMQGPRIVVTIEGTTPYGEPYAFLGQNFLNWFRENGDRKNRPYTIEVPSETTEAMKVVRIGDTTMGTTMGRSSGRSTTSAATRPGASRDMMGMGDDMMGMGMMGGMGEMGGDMGMGMGRSFGGNNNAASLLPTRPLLDEDFLDDHKFTIKLYFNLRKPADARVTQAEAKSDNVAAPAEEVDEATDVAEEQANNDNNMEEVQA
ncbi:type IV pilus assembly protein PilM [Planctomycetota bacterium]|nr:type IV pilus assembly protein PilM [Planctomycetota bacterium]